MKDEKDINLGNDAKADEPILVIKRKKLFYGPIYAIIKILQFYVVIFIIFSNKYQLYITIIGYIFLIGMLYVEILSNSFKSILCYDDKFIFNSIFGKSKIIEYSKIREITIFTNPISRKKILYIRVNFILNALYVNRIAIPMDYLNKNDFEDFKTILQNKCIKYFSM